MSRQRWNDKPRNWRPTDLRLPSGLKVPVTPTTAFSLSSASVVAGSSRFDLAGLICADQIGRGKRLGINFQSDASAVFGLTPVPTPPNFYPAIA